MNPASMPPPSAGAISVWLLVAGAVGCNVIAQLSIKRAAPVALLPLHHWFAPSMIAAVAFYGISFVLTALVYSRLPLTVASPLMTGAVFALIAVSATWLLGETLSPVRIAGMALVALGVLLLARDV